MSCEHKGRTILQALLDAILEGSEEDKERLESLILNNQKTSIAFFEEFDLANGSNKGIIYEKSKRLFAD